MDTALILSVALLGLAGMPHCAAMCSAPCALAGGRRPFKLLAGRVLGYAAGGAAAAASAQLLAQATQGITLLQPAWALLQAALLLFGLLLLVRGRMPAWLGSIRWRPQPRHALVTGVAWVLMPCGLLQGALLMASLTGSALSGGVAMAGFALASTPGLLLGPLWRARLLKRGADGDVLALRLAGLTLAIGAGWGLAHGVWQRVMLAC
ncbi:sulfite exporter TauE/SafE family protein [Pelomonas sp. UHG3]|uniref:Sulfite exporter TauE/SafE family protein n=1 Tax=Roseateles hydrophilus TaxID=2975054 RepID=A0ACC6CFU2_9BURK|nr:sulfite exporter TauE/SafE family protein [Pelomonas sp. UHG3]MCY4747251.1 sulfite exporter TauE/SafE family protein [Pelomonas sp. UHG3]